MPLENDISMRNAEVRGILHSLDTDMSSLLVTLDTVAENLLYLSSVLDKAEDLKLLATALNEATSVVRGLYEVDGKDIVYIVTHMVSFYNNYMLYKRNFSNTLQGIACGLRRSDILMVGVRDMEWQRRLIEVVNDCTDSLGTLIEETGELAASDEFASSDLLARALVYYEAGLRRNNEMQLWPSDGLMALPERIENIVGIALGWAKQPSLSEQCVSASGPLIAIANNAGALCKLYKIGGLIEKCLRHITRLSALTPECSAGNEDIGAVFNDLRSTVVITCGQAVQPGPPPRRANGVQGKAGTKLIDSLETLHYRHAKVVSTAGKILGAHIAVRQYAALVSLWLARCVSLLHDMRICANRYLRAEDSVDVAYAADSDDLALAKLVSHIVGSQITRVGAGGPGPVVADPCAHTATTDLPCSSAGNNLSLAEAADMLAGSLITFSPVPDRADGELEDSYILSVRDVIMPCVTLDPIIANDRIEDSLPVDVHAEPFVAEPFRHNAATDLPCSSMDNNSSLAEAALVPVGDPVMSSALSYCHDSDECIVGLRDAMTSSVVSDCADDKWGSPRMLLAEDDIMPPATLDILATNDYLGSQTAFAGPHGDLGDTKTALDCTYSEWESLCTLLVQEGAIMPGVILDPLSASGPRR